MWIQNIGCQVYGGCGPMGYKEETVNWMITGSVVVHNFVRIQEGLVCDMVDKCFYYFRWGRWWMAEIIEGAAFEKSPGWLFLNICSIRLPSVGLCQFSDINNYVMWEVI
jgi:hypothetical protein